MPHSLDGARLKVVRAKEHLESFNECSGRYTSDEPCKVVTEITPDYVSFKGVIATEPPSSLACIVGDFVTNLRASLDYIAWELVNKAGIALSDRQKRRVTFPIVSDKNSFTNPDGTANHLQTVCGVPASAINVIESVQPYNAGYEPLSSLDFLVRTDKHRTLLLCTSIVESSGKISVFRRGQLAWTESGMTATKRHFTTDGGPGIVPSDYSVEVNEKPTIHISFKDFPSPGQTTHAGILADILKCVADIVPRFDRFF